MNIFEGIEAVSNIHPLFVHFPIALLTISSVLFIAGKFINSTDILIAAKWNLILGSLSALATAFTGMIAAGSLPHNYEIHQAMLMHRSILMPTTFLALGLSFYIYDKKDLSRLKGNIVFLGLLILMTVLLAIGADYGGKMVFKYGAGTELFLKLNPDAGRSHDHKRVYLQSQHSEHNHSEVKEHDDTKKKQHSDHEHDHKEGGGHKH